MEAEIKNINELVFWYDENVNRFEEIKTQQDQFIENMKNMKKTQKQQFSSLKNDLWGEIEMNGIIAKNCEEKIEVFSKKVQQIKDYLSKVDMTQQIWDRAGSASSPRRVFSPARKSPGSPDNEQPEGFRLKPMSLETEEKGDPDFSDLDSPWRGSSGDGAPPGTGVTDLLIPMIEKLREDTKKQFEESNGFMKTMKSEIYKDIDA